MKYLNHEEISYCTVFNIELSQDELEVYERCLNYVKEKCDDEEIYELTGCTQDEFINCITELKNLITNYVRPEVLSDKYK